MTAALLKLMFKTSCCALVSCGQNSKSNSVLKFAQIKHNLTHVVSEYSSLMGQSSICEKKEDFLKKLLHA